MIARLAVALGIVLFAAGGLDHRDALAFVGAAVACGGGLGVLVAIRWG
jgi:hypothetical protein